MCSASARSTTRAERRPGEDGGSEPRPCHVDRYARDHPIINMPAEEDYLRLKHAWEVEH